MDCVDLFPLLDDHSSCLEELEKLRLANKLAHQVLREKCNNNSLQTLDKNIANPSYADEKMKGNIYSKEENQFNVEVHEDRDNWGAAEYLQHKDFQYVQDYLHRTERLLNMSDSVMHIPNRCSYKIVSSSEELLQSPESPDESCSSSTPCDDLKPLNSCSSDAEQLSFQQPETLFSRSHHEIKLKNIEVVPERHSKLGDTIDCKTNSARSEQEKIELLDLEENDSFFHNKRTNFTTSSAGNDHLEENDFSSTFEKVPDHAFTVSDVEYPNIGVSDEGTNANAQCVPSTQAKTNEINLKEANETPSNPFENDFEEHAVSASYVYNKVQITTDQSSNELKAISEIDKSVLVPSLNLASVYWDEEAKIDDNSAFANTETMKAEHKTRKSNEKTFKPVISKKNVNAASGNGGQGGDEFARKSVVSTTNSLVKPQRKWERSSIAWSSCGKRELRTWSSIQIPTHSSKLPPSQQRKNKRLEQSPMKLMHGHHLNTSNYWCSLPDEVTLHVFSFFSALDLLNAGQVCKLFNRIANDCCLWKSVKANDIILNDQWFAAMGERNPRSISLIGCNGKSVTNVGLRNFFKNCKTSLTELQVEKCSGEYLTGDAVLLHASCHCRKLKRVNVAWSKTTDNGLIAISLALPVLQSLNINGNSTIGDEAFEILTQKHGRHVTSLEMSGCFAVTSDVLRSLVLSTKSLEKLNIGLCSKITEDCIIDMCPNLHSLQYLDLRGIKSVSNHSLHSLATHCCKLTTLVVSNCSSITDVGLAEIATYRASLAHLDISGCSQVTDEGTTNIAMSATSLEYLDLSSTGATHKTIDVIVNCNNLTLNTLKLSFCHNITQSCLTNLLNTVTSLKSLHLYGCKRIKLAQMIRDYKHVTIEK